MQPAISSVGLSKRYRVPALHEESLRTATGIETFTGRLSRRGRAGDTWIDAVADVSFDVASGEAVGLIGRNGAGKSTLLKLLSRVTRPSAGHADIYGRVGALLEVGTGFHPELTGRENTFLSGAILGMPKRAITAEFDQIVEFAEIAPFIDMPVKHYSSGMYARLGFAVAAFLKPEILIVDEILAVGDLAFQAKCLVHMKKLSQDGTTVLFVSHNLLSMADFCPRALVISEGTLAFDGPTSDAIAIYRGILAGARERQETDGRPSHALRIDGNSADPTLSRLPNDSLAIELEVEVPPNGALGEIELNLVLETPDGRMPMHLRNDLAGTVLRLGPGRNTLTVDIDDLGLAPGSYWLWMRVVALQEAAPTIWDTDRIELIIAGDQRQASLLQPRHRFGQR